MEGMEPLHYASYKDLTDSVRQHMAFCTQVRALVADQLLQGDSPENALRGLSRSITVANKPFSMASHLLALDMNSDEWGVFAMEPADIAALAKENAYFKQTFDPTYDMGPYILGFAQACDKHGMTQDAAFSGPC